MYYWISVYLVLFGLILVYLVLLLVTESKHVKKHLKKPVTVFVRLNLLMMSPIIYITHMNIIYIFNCHVMLEANIPFQKDF